MVPFETEEHFIKLAFCYKHILLQWNFKLIILLALILLNDTTYCCILMFVILFLATYEALYEFVTKSSSLLAKNCTYLDDVLQTLDEQENSIGILGVL